MGRAAPRSAHRIAWREWAHYQVSGFIQPNFGAAPPSYGAILAGAQRYRANFWYLIR